MVKNLKKSRNHGATVTEAEKPERELKIRIAIARTGSSQ